MLPTGFEKSKTFQILPSVKKTLDRSSFSSLVVVVCQVAMMLLNTLYVHGFWDHKYVS